MINDYVKTQFLKELRKFINNEISIERLTKSQNHLNLAKNDYNQFMTEMKNYKFEFYKKLNERLLNIEKLCSSDNKDIDINLIKKYSRIVGLARRVLINENGSLPCYPVEEMLDND